MVIVIQGSVHILVNVTSNGFKRGGRALKSRPLLQMLVASSVNAKQSGSAVGGCVGGPSTIIFLRLRRANGAVVLRQHFNEKLIFKLNVEGASSDKTIDE